MILTIEEARALYAQGGMAREVALRTYSEGEILNDYTTVTKLPEESESLNTPTVKLYARLYEVYKTISKGRPLKLTTSAPYYLPKLILSNVAFRPNNGTFVGKVKIDNNIYSIFINTRQASWEGRLGFENDGVPCGTGILDNRWCFKDKAQAEHFVKHFYKELIQFELGDSYTVKFVDNE